MALDDAFEILGVKGMFPLGIYLMTLYVGISTPWILLIDSFAGYVPQHHCYVENYTSNSNMSDFFPPDVKSSDGYDECQKYDAFKNITSCQNFTYENDEGDSDKISYVSLWNLVCDRLILAKFATTSFFIGNIVGNMIFTYISDRYGRVRVLIWTQWSQCIFGALLAFSGSLGGLPTYIVLRMILGALSGATYNVGFIYMNEMFAPRHRNIVGMVSNVVWSVATAALPGIAFLIPDWRFLIIAVTLPNVATIIWVWLFPESMKWQMRNGRSAEALAYLQKVAEARGVQLPESILEDEENELKKSKQNNEIGCIDMMRHGIVVRCIVIGMLLFFVTSLVYYGLTMSSTSLSENRYFSFFLSGLAEIPGYTIAMLLITYFGRRRPMMWLMTIAGISMLTLASLSLAIKDLSTSVTLTLNFLGKFGISGTYGIVVLLITEIFPTNMRTAALGWCTVGARLGSIWSPYASILQEKSPSTLQFIFGICALLGTVGTFFLPETHNRALPNDVEDVKTLEAQTERWRRNKIDDMKSQLIASD